MLTWRSMRQLSRMNFENNPLPACSTCETHFYCIIIISGIIFVFFVLWVIPVVSYCSCLFPSRERRGLVLCLTRCSAVSTVHLLVSLSLFGDSVKLWCIDDLISDQYSYLFFWYYKRLLVLRMLSLPQESTNPVRATAQHHLHHVDTIWPLGTPTQENLHN